MKFLTDVTVKSKLANAKKLIDVDEEDYCAVYYVGGHGAMMDLPFDPVNARLASQVAISLWLIFSFSLIAFFSSTKLEKSRWQYAMVLRVYRISSLH